MAAVSGVIGVAPAEAATFTVDSSLDVPDVNPGDGVCATSANVCTLRAAVQEANALVVVGTNTINIPAGTYTVTSRIQIQASVDIFGENAATTIISGGSTQPIFQVIMPSGASVGPTVNIHRLTLSNGHTVIADAGAALRNEKGATTRLWDSVVRDNDSSTFGGGIYNWGTLRITRSEIRNNRLPAGGGGVTSSGGGIFNGGELEIACSAVTENFATRGGGISNQSVVKIKNSTISSNLALGGGGGIRNVANGSVFISLSTVTLNRGNDPSNDGSEPNRTGGGIQTLSPALTVIGSTILAGNTDNRSGFEADYSPDCFSDSSTAFTTMRFNLIGVVNNQCQLRDSVSGTNTSFDLQGNNTTPLDPKLGILSNNGGLTRTHSLHVGSPAIDSNTTSASSTIFACESIDQRGSFRPVDGDGDGKAECDIGAYEFQGATLPDNSPACDSLQFDLPQPGPPAPPAGLRVQ